MAMPGVADAAPASSPVNGELMARSSAGKEAKEESLAFYKAQYEQLEAELADFQSSSKELEAELERDVEEAEKRERALRERNEGLQFEVDEWKTKYKQAKAEANTAQNSLQKDITSLRDANRTLQLKLRDIEVQNDDFERQARNTTSSLEDLESKYNRAIERAVLLEGEIKAAEQEREDMRIETQRLRDELSDLKVEAEIRQDKLRHAEANAMLLQKQAAPIPRPSSIHSDEHSHVDDDATTTTSSAVATPPTKSVSSAMSDKGTPPSPPMSDQSQSQSRSTAATTQPIKSRLHAATNPTTPRPLTYSARPSRLSRGPMTSSIATPAGRRISTSRAEAHNGTATNSSSLTQIRGLIGKMQRLEQRVQMARSKLPAPTNTPPRASPRPGSALSQTSNIIPSSVTVRSTRKRTSVATATTTSTRESSTTPSASSETRDHNSRRSFGFTPSASISGAAPPPMSRETHHRTSLSLARPASRQSLSNRDTGFARPPSRQSLTSRQSMSHLNSGYSIGTGPADSLNSGISSSVRSASRQSLSTRQSMSHLRSASSRAGSSASSRPPSRSSISGARTPLGGGASYGGERIARPHSSIGGSYGGHASWHTSIDEADDNTPGKVLPSESAVAGVDVSTPTPSRRTTLGKEGATAIPMPSSAAKRSSLSTAAAGTSKLGVDRRIGVHANGRGDMGPPERRKGGNVGETF